MSDELIRNQINDIIEGEIQNGINDFLEEKQKKKLIRDGFRHSRRSKTTQKSKSLKMKLTKS